MAIQLKMNPKTQGPLSVTVLKSDGTVATDATVTATVYSPIGVVIVTDTAMPHSGSGVYVLTVLPAWSTAADLNAIEGRFVAEVKAVRVGVTRTRRIKFDLDWDA